MNKISLFVVFSFISLFFYSLEEIVVLPFKILKKNNLSKVSDPYTFLRNEIENSIYTEILLGEPSEKITFIVTFNSEDLEMHHQITKNLFSNTLYKRENSKTFKKIEKEKDDTTTLKEYFKESIKLYSDKDFKNLITIKELNFSLYETKEEKLKEKDGSLVINLGLKLYENDIYNAYTSKIYTNIITQLKHKGIISSYNFNFHFNPLKLNNDLYDGILIIGNEPHQYLKDSYNEMQLFKTRACRRDRQLSWDIYFNKIFYKYNGEEKILDKGIEYYNEASLTPSSGIIEGTMTYERNIRNNYFSQLIKEKKCFRIYKDYSIFYYCDKNKINKKDLESFPTLYFSNLELNQIFELDYNDLFLLNDNIYYFLIYFYDYPEEIKNEFDEYVSRWDLGTPFLKKYFFTYDYDNKYIGFYNNNTIIHRITPKEKEKPSNRNYSWIIILFLCILCIITVFLFLRKYMIKKTKFRAIELEADSNLKYSNYYNVEMGQKNALIDGP